MFLLAGILFIAAMLLAFVDWYLDNANVDLTALVRLLLFASVILIGLNTYWK